MTDFTALAIVPRKLFENENVEKAVPEFIAKNMAPYYEGLKVEPYETTCGCIGGEAREEAENEAAEKLGSFAEIRKAFVEENKEFISKFGLGSKEEYELWLERITPLRKLENKCFNSHPKKNLPKEDCKHCKGTGKVITSYNPNSKWDWYVIGKSDEVKNAVINKEWAVLVNNRHVKTSSLKLNEFLERAKKTPDIIPYVLLTKDGKWVAKGRLGWYGLAFEEIKDWNKKFIRLLRKMILKITEFCFSHTSSKKMAEFLCLS